MFGAVFVGEDSVAALFVGEDGGLVGEDGSWVASWNTGWKVSFELAETDSSIK